MTRIQETILVEGRYDANKLRQIVETQVLETSGFGIFKNAEKRVLLQKIAAARGIVVLTDSDSAGFVIRNHLRGILPREQVKHAYIPQIAGKEKRKLHASKEGLLGVEGISDALILDALRRAGATFLDETVQKDCGKLNKTDFYTMGLSGGTKSKELRVEMLRALGLPVQMSANAMLEAVNLLFSREEFFKQLDAIRERVTEDASH